MKHLALAAALAMGVTTAAADTPELQMTEETVTKNVSLNTGSMNGLVVPLALIAIIVVVLDD